MDDFEKRLQRLPRRTIPGGWRAGILTAAQRRPPSWREWLWPYPRAWGGLAVAWLVILAMYVAAGGNPQQSRTRQLAFSRQEFLELREQQLALAQLIAPAEKAETPPPKETALPRSERRRTEFGV